MTDHPLLLDFPSVRQQSRALLEKISRFFSDLNTAESRRYQEQIAHQLNLVDRLELRMTIVAPMKAGKSTIINALIGQELLPSHSAAMTTLPTEILFAPQRNEPVLRLGTSLVAACQETASRIREQINRQGLDHALAQAGQYPHLHNLITSLHEDFRIEEEIAGREQAVAMLTALNHLIRLAAVLTEQPADLSQSEIPVLETPFRHGSGIGDADADTDADADEQHRFVLVDTPGPNEAGTHHLQALVDRQLEQSSLILIVLDFTQLKSAAAEEVKENVRQIAGLRGADNLYVLVNKIDQRDAQSMTAEEIRAFVAADLGISNPEQVFEISARQALAAASFLRELTDGPDDPSLSLPLAEMPAAQQLARQTLGLRWQERLHSISKDDMEREAEYLWKLSGFPAFLDRAMHKLILESPHRCLRTALQTGQNCLGEWRESNSPNCICNPG